MKKIAKVAVGKSTAAGRQEQPLRTAVAIARARAR
jgi:hypothetical protein